MRSKFCLLLCIAFSLFLCCHSMASNETFSQGETITFVVVLDVSGSMQESLPRIRAYFRDQEVREKFATTARCGRSSFVTLTIFNDSETACRDLNVSLACASCDISPAVHTLSMAPFEKRNVMFTISPRKTGQQAILANLANGDGHVGHASAVFDVRGAFGFPNWLLEFVYLFQWLIGLIGVSAILTIISKTQKKLKESRQPVTGSSIITNF